MSGKILRLFTVSVLLMAGGVHASAQTAEPPESITITGTKLREVLGKFTFTFATPSKLTGKIARWERRICPVVVGQNPHFTTFIVQRVKYVAQAVGAPVNTDASCTPNIEIVFTTTPQKLLDSVRKDDTLYLGYATNNDQLDRLATVTRPIQAWYAVEAVDLDGVRRADNGMSNSNGDPVPNFDGHPIYNKPPTQRVTGNLIVDGIRSGFNHILIVVDTTRLAGQNFVPLADYVSLLALTQLNSLDACQELPSVVNRLAPDCDHAVDGLTLYDLAYLQGLYKMSAGRGAVLQRDDIADAMLNTLTKAK